MKNARALAVEALVKVERAKAYSNLTLDQLLEQEGKTRSEDPHWRAESAFASTLFYGVLERKLTLDACIQKYAVRGLSGMACEVLQILRISFYQLLYMENIPESAVVNEAVKLTRAFKQPKASGFVNGMLRGFLRDNKELPHYKDPLKELSIRYSLPQWILGDWRKTYGAQDAEKMAAAFLEPSVLFARVNPLKNTPEELEALLKEQLSGEDAEQISLDEHLPGCIRMSGVGSVRRIPAFAEGRFHVQDKSSQLCALALGAKPGERVLDLCAAPGGKTFTIAETMNGEGRVDSSDLYEQRVKLIADGAKRLGLQNVRTQAGDALKPVEETEIYDRILCDVPCSGIGILGRKPEIRYKDPKEFQDLPGIQYQILENAAKQLKKGGTLVYSTCTLRQEENHQVTEKFLKAHPDFRIVPLPESCGAFAGMDGELTLLPHRYGTDGFYICRMQKI